MLLFIIEVIKSSRFELYFCVFLVVLWFMISGLITTCMQHTCMPYLTRFSWFVNEVLFAISIMSYILMYYIVHCLFCNILYWIAFHLNKIHNSNNWPSTDITPCLWLHRFGCYQHDFVFIFLFFLFFGSVSFIKTLRGRIVANVHGL